MLLYVLMIISGILLLVWSADKFTDGSAALARNLGISPLIIGLTIVAIGSSAPEMVVSFNAAIDGTPRLAIGNAIGSNIANIGLVLGITALIAPLTVNSSLIKREIPILFAVMCLALILMLDNALSFIDGIILIIALLVYLGWLTRVAIVSRNNQDTMLKEIVDEIPDQMSNGKAVFWIIVGLAVLQVSAKMLVLASTTIAMFHLISPYIIGATIVAVGTSLPELAACISGAMKGEDELAIGNIIGSNIFNLLAVMGIPALIGIPLVFEASEWLGNDEGSLSTSLPAHMLTSDIIIGSTVITVDYTLMFIITILFAIMAWGKNSKAGQINRFEGLLLLLIFIGYQGFLIAKASGLLDLIYYFSHH